MTANDHLEFHNLTNAGEEISDEELIELFQFFFEEEDWERDYVKQLLGEMGE